MGLHAEEVCPGRPAVTGARDRAWATPSRWITGIFGVVRALLHRGRGMRSSLQLFALLGALACGLQAQHPGGRPEAAGADVDVDDASPTYASDGEEPDEVVLQMPASAERSIDSVASYIEQRVPRGRQRVAVLHDWVADRIAYAPGGPTSAQQTFEERRGVCAGYSALLHALANAADEEVGYVAGVARDSKGQELGRHAWNVAHIDHRDLPIDVTWDAGHMADGVFVKRFSRHWLFVTSTEFAETHVPDD